MRSHASQSAGLRSPAAALRACARARGLAFSFCTPSKLS